MIARRSNRSRSAGKAFTLIELLVVLAIIGLLAAVSIPALKGIGQGNRMSSATQQLLNDLSLARQRAIVNQTTVHVVFVPTFSQMNAYSTPPSTSDAKVFNRLKGGCQTTYALFAERTVGDQPGQPRARYLTQWRSLPDGVFIASQEFDPSANPWDKPFEIIDGLPFPTSTSPRQNDIAHVAFGRSGSLVDLAGKLRFEDEYIWLTKGSVLASYDGQGNVSDVNVRESPAGNWTNNFNRIRIDGMTGRAKLERPEIE